MEAGTIPTLQSGAGKTISFRLSGGGNTLTLTLPINPEELQKDSPARITTTQTLGGAFQDVDTIGIQTLTMTGTTGWRGRPGQKDGFQYAQHLFKYIYEEYYNRIQTGNIPELLLIDGVNGYTYQVSMDDFQMARNKSEPLLFRYTIPMTVLKDVTDPIESGLDDVKQTVQDIFGKTVAATQLVQKYNTNQQRTYTVKSGDTLSGIALMFYGDGTKYKIIANANNILAPYTIYPGRVLVIPNS